MFRQGDMVVHPNHGAGVIREIRDSDGLNGFSSYYIVELFANRLTVMVPRENAVTIGLRQADPSLVTQAKEVLNEQPQFLPSETRQFQDRVWLGAHGLDLDRSVAQITQGDDSLQLLLDDAVSVPFARYDRAVGDDLRLLGPGVGLVY